MTHPGKSLRRFLLSESGALYPTTTWVMLTLAVSLPVGMALFRIYEALCMGGRVSNLLLGIF